MDLILALVLLTLLISITLFAGRRLKIPGIVCYLVIGILAGPYVLGIITDQATIGSIGQIGVILLLFVIGLELSFAEISRSWRVLILGGALQLCTTIAASAALMYLASGIPFNQAIFFGFLISLSSTAIVMKILQERGEVETVSGRTLLGILIFQDLAIIPMALITPLLAEGGRDSGFPVPLQAAKIIGILVMLIFAARRGVPWLLCRVAKQRSTELFFTAVAGICFTVAWLTSAAGLSYSLGAFLAGLIVGESDFRIDAFSRIIPFRDVFTAIFFISIGMLLDPGVIVNHAGMVFTLVVAILVVKSLTGSLSAAALGMPVRVAVFVGLALSQIGEFSFVLAQTGLSEHLMGVENYQVFLAGAIVTMALTPFTMAAAPLVTSLAYRVLPGELNRGEKPVDREKGWGELSDHIIIVGYGMTGWGVARAAEIAGMPYLAIDLDPEVVRREREAGHGEHIFFGDATRQEVLEHAGIRRARAIVIVIAEQKAIPAIIHLARAMAPGISIIVRTRHARDARPMLDLGADEIIPEEFEASVRIFSRILDRYGLPEPEITLLSGKARDDGYRMFTRSPEGMPARTEDSLGAGYRIHTITVAEKSGMAGKSLRELDTWKTHNIRILGVRRGTSTMTLPPPEIQIRAGDHLILWTSDADLHMFHQLATGEKGKGGGPPVSRDPVDDPDVSSA